MDKHLHLATRFTQLLQSALTPEQWAEMVATNTTDPCYWDGGACASHNYLDANMVTDAAFTDVVGRAFDHDSDADIGLWNDGWNLAFTTWTGRPRP
jgi:hypothetical protein